MKRHIVLAIASFTVGAVMISSLIVAGVAQAAVGYTLNRSGKTITVDWDDVVGATSYSVTPVVNGIAMTPVIMTTSDYSDTSTIPNTSYIYQVVATTTDGPVDLFTTSATRYSLTTPALTAKAVSYNTIDLKFSAVHGVQKYEVYRSTAKTKGFVQVASTDKLSFVDKSRTTGTSYYYKVRGVQVVDGKTYRTGWSAVKNARTSLDRTKATVTSPSYHTAKVTFSKVSGATSYKVYRSTSSKKGFKLVKTTKSLSYTNTKLKTGTRYYYKVVPHRGKVKAAASATVSVKPVLKKTKFKTAGTSLGKVKVTWSKVSGATGYKVYRSTSATKGFKVVKTVKGTSFTDTKLANNKTYYYKVAAYRKVSSKTVSSGATSVFKITTPRKAGHYYFSKGGFFVLQTSGSGYYEVCKKTKCNWSTADTNHIFQNKTYVDVPAGYYLRFTAYGSKDARITRADSHYATTKSTITAPGHYLVGFDLKPGEYRIYSSKDWSYTICAWTSCDWTNGYDDIELVSKGEYIIITLSSGDFLEISTFGGSIKGTRR